MKYGLMPENPVEREGIAANPQVRTLFDPFIPAIISQTLIAAADCGVFEALAPGQLSPEQLAEKLSLDKNMLDSILRVLTCCDYLTKDGENYSLSELARLSLIGPSPVSLNSWVRLNGIQWRAFSRMGEVLRSGECINFHTEFGTDTDWEIYQYAMMETARPAAEWVAVQIALPSEPKLMLDIGGSHGLYSAAICRANPPLKSEIMELAQAIPAARQIARELDITDAVSFIEGDILAADLGREKYDAVFMGNIIHHFTEEQNLGIIGKIRLALKSAGTLAIWDLRKPESASAPDLISDCFALFFQITSASKCFSGAEILGWLEAEGFAEIKICPAPTHNLITARKI